MSFFWKQEGSREETFLCVRWYSLCACVCVCVFLFCRTSRHLKKKRNVSSLLEFASASFCVFKNKVCRGGNVTCRCVEKLVGYSIVFSKTVISSSDGSFVASCGEAYTCFRVRLHCTFLRIMVKYPWFEETCLGHCTPPLQPKSQNRSLSGALGDFVAIFLDIAVRHCESFQTHLCKTSSKIWCFFLTLMKWFCGLTSCIKLKAKQCWEIPWFAKKLYSDKINSELTGHKIVMFVMVQITKNISSHSRSGWIKTAGVPDTI